jgi:DNA-binding response OmpR family regulator
MRKSILIIDDSNTALLLMEYVLNESGYKTWLASDVKEAIKIINKQIPNMILLDLSMPEISGYDFLKMKNDLRLEKVPIIVVSACDSEESVKLTVDFGAVDFISKPIKMDVLKEKIKSYFNE